MHFCCVGVGGVGLCRSSSAFFLAVRSSGVMVLLAAKTENPPKSPDSLVGSCPSVVRNGLIGLSSLATGVYHRSATCQRGTVGFPQFGDFGNERIVHPLPLIFLFTTAPILLCSGTSAITSADSMSSLIYTATTLAVMNPVFMWSPVLGRKSTSW